MTTICDDVNRYWRHRLLEIVEKSRKSNIEHGFSICDDGTITDVVSGQQDHMRVPRCENADIQISGANIKVGKRTITTIHTHSTKTLKGLLPSGDIERYKRIIGIPSSSDIKNAIYGFQDNVCIVNSSRGITPKLMCMQVKDREDIAFEATIMAENLTDVSNIYGIVLNKPNLDKMEKFHSWLLDNGACEIDVL